MEFVTRVGLRDVAVGCLTAMLIGGLAILLAGVARAASSRGLHSEWILIGAAGAVAVWMFRGLLLGLLAIVAPYGWFKGEQGPRE